MSLKRKWMTFSSVAIMGTTIYFGSTALISNADGNSGSSAGSVNDPLITKSYVDTKVAELVKHEVAEQLKGGQVPAATPTPQSTPSLTPSINPDDTNNGQALTNITVVQLQPGQILYAGSGAEFIVRTGKLVAVSSDENGIPDVTAGTDIAAGSPIELNHLLIFPREGRGIKPDPKNKGDIYIMVRGAYMVMNADGSMVSP